VTKICTITNDDIPDDNGDENGTLIVTKVVVNDSGGEKQVSDFTLSIGNDQVTSGQENSVIPGAYLVSEASDADYTGTIGGDCDANGNVTVGAGETKNCTITNDDLTLVCHVPPGNPENEQEILIPDEDVAAHLGHGDYLGACTGGGDDDGDNDNGTLVVTKVVVNNDGGEKQVSDFTLSVGDQVVISGTENSFAAGSYQVSESSDDNYEGTFSGDCDAEGNVTVVSGETKTCILTNDDIALEELCHIPPGNPENAHTISVSQGDVQGHLDHGDHLGPCDGGTLIVNKVVVNNDGGEKEVQDFRLYIDANIVLSGEESSVAPGTYLVSEAPDEQYAGTIGGDCDTEGNVTVGEGETKTCTITNDDIATDDGGGGDQSGELVLAKSVEPLSVSAGQQVTYTITVENDTAVAQSFSLADVLSLGTNGGTLSVTPASVTAAFTPALAGTFSGTYPDFIVTNLAADAVITITYTAVAGSGGIDFNEESVFFNTVTLTQEDLHLQARAGVTVRGPTKGNNGGGGGGGTRHGGGGGGGGNLSSDETGKLSADDEGHPEEPLTLGFAACMMMDMLGEDLSTVIVPPFSYPDVRRTHPRAACIKLAKQLGIMIGYGDGTFHPDAPMTEAEGLITLYRAFHIRYTPKVPLPLCRDLEAYAWYRLPISQAVHDKIITVEDNLCKPYKIIDRGTFNAFIAAFGAL